LTRNRNRSKNHAAFAKKKDDFIIFHRQVEVQPLGQGFQGFKSAKARAIEGFKMEIAKLRAQISQTLRAGSRSEFIHRCKKITTHYISLAHDHHDFDGGLFHHCFIIVSSDSGKSDTSLR
jgi:hypothetical protein